MIEDNYIVFGISKNNEWDILSQNGKFPDEFDVTELIPDNFHLINNPEDLIIKIISTSNDKLFVSLTYKNVESPETFCLFFNGISKFSYLFDNEMFFSFIANTRGIPRSLFSAFKISDETNNSMKPLKTGENLIFQKILFYLYIPQKIFFKNHLSFSGVIIRNILMNMFMTIPSGIYINITIKKNYKNELLLFRNDHIRQIDNKFCVQYKSVYQNGYNQFQLIKISKHLLDRY